MRPGLVLLEVLVALVVLSLVALGALQLTHQSGVLASNARQWSDAVMYAEDGMELAKLESSVLHGPPGGALPGGFRRQVVRQPLDSGFERVIVTVFLPGGGRFDLERLVHTADDGSDQW